MPSKNNKLSSILETLRQNLALLNELYSVETLEVFGSYVRTEQKPGSDVDILVTYSELPSLFKFIELENYLSDLLGLKVDLVMKDALKPTIGLRIKKEALRV